MKLLKCYIERFGKFENFEYDFSDGINVIEEENGWGKSTFADFLKCIFYGISGNKKSVEENMRLKYKPWNYNGLFGGYVLFSRGGKKFKLERYFGQKESEDTVRLFDGDTGREYSDNQNLGERLFGIDEHGFTSTVYFSQGDLDGDTDKGVLIKYDSEVGAYDDKNIDIALKKLSEKAKEYKKTGDKGKIADTKREIYAVNESIERAKSAVKDAEYLTEKLNVKTADLKKVEEEIKTLEKEVEILTRAKEAKFKAATLSDAEARNKRYAEKIATADNVLLGNRPKKEEIDMYIKSYGDLVSARDKKGKLEEEKRILKAQNSSSKINIFMILGIIFAAVSVVGIALIFVSLPIGVAILSIGLVSSAIFFVLFFIKGNNKKIKAAETELDSKIKFYDDIIDSYVKAFSEFLAKFNVTDRNDFLSSFNEIKYNMEVYESAKAELAENEKTIGEIKNSDYAVNSDNLFVSADENRLSVATYSLSEKRAERERLNAELTEMRLGLKRYADVSNNLSDFESRKTELKEKLQEYTEEYEILIKTAEYLNKANDNLKIKYKEPIENAFRKYAGIVFGKNSDNLNVDIDFNVSVSEIGGDKKTGFYSEGYRNSFEICKRLALIEALYKDEKPFLVLDDPFSNLDEKKISNSLKILETLKDEFQIIYLVCHSSRNFKK